MTDPTILAGSPTSPPESVPPSGSKVFAAIIATMRDIGAVGKNHRNDFQKYQFRGIDDFLDECHGPMAAHGLVLLPTIDGDPKVVERKTTTGKEELHIIVKVRWTFYGEDGSNVSFTTLGEASDTGDKGCNKAMSASQKYALIQAFQIPVTESDRDTEERSPEWRGKMTAPALPPPKVVQERMSQMPTKTAQEPAGRAQTATPVPAGSSSQSAPTVESWAQEIAAAVKTAHPLQVLGPMRLRAKKAPEPIRSALAKMLQKAWTEAGGK